MASKFTVKGICVNRLCYNDAKEERILTSFSDTESHIAPALLERTSEQAILSTFLFLLLGW